MERKEIESKSYGLMELLGKLTLIFPNRADESSYVPDHQNFLTSSLIEYFPYTCVVGTAFNVGNEALRYVLEYAINQIQLAVSKL